MTAQGLEQAVEQVTVYQDKLDLVALPSAVPVSCLFVAYTLTDWGVPADVVDSAVLVTNELVHDAVKTGVSEWNGEELAPLWLCLYVTTTSVYIETWDTAEYEELPNQPFVVPAVRRWGSKPWPRGRMIWAELELYRPTEDGLPKRTPQPVEGLSIQEDTTELPSLEFLRRVRDGIGSL